MLAIAMPQTAGGKSTTHMKLALITAIAVSLRPNKLNQHQCQRGGQLQTDPGPTRQVTLVVRPTTKPAPSNANTEAGVRHYANARIDKAGKAHCQDRVATSR